MKRTFTAVALLAGLGAYTSQASLLAYEGFDYAVGTDVLDTMNGGIGFASAWERAQEGGNDEITVYDGSGLDPDWDGVMSNLPTSPTPNRYISGAASNDDRITAQRTLSQSAGAMAGGDNVLWASVVWRMNGGNYGRQVGFILGTDGISNRSRNVSTNGNFGAGLGDGIGVGGAINTTQVTPVIFDNGGIAVRDNTSPDSVSTSQANLIILKYVFADGAGLDRVYAWSYLDSELATLTEATFNSDTAASFVEYAIDEDTLNILSFGQSQVSKEAIDEIRLGDTFTDVVSGVVPEPGSLALLSLGGLMIARRRRG